MKNFIILSLALVAAPVFANGAEVCGQLKSYNKALPGHYATVALQDGAALPVVLGQSGEAMIVTSIASNLTVCFEERQSSAGIFYEIGAISK
jgi:hypothetical protein